jgi:large subunit ribosomal protein L29
MAKNENMVVAKELRERSEAELRSLLAAKVEELHKVKFNHALGQLRDTHTLKLLKKDIARLKTVLKEQAKETAA